MILPCYSAFNLTLLTEVNRNRYIFVFGIINNFLYIRDSRHIFVKTIPYS